jgi:anti-sigma regulatory factor (Ser/Thr protein kinase)
MEMNLSTIVPITDTSSVGEARRAGMATAERLGFDETRCGDFALLASEVSRNVLLHGGGGQTIIQGHRNGRGPVGQILALDKGPGIQNMAKAMSDGYSTSGTMGAGLGAMKRIADSLEIFSSAQGTVVFLEVDGTEKAETLQVAGVAVPYPGEVFCGDAWGLVRRGEQTLLMLVDGLGHGREAAEAANEAVRTFQKHSDRGPAQILSYMHDALKKTRGAAAAVAAIDTADKSVTYAGVGNTACAVLGAGSSRSLVSHNGTLGAATPRLQEFRVEWPEQGILIMHSDGLQSRWDLSPYAGLLARHSAVIGGVLLRDFRRQRDDASVVVVKAS